MAEILQNKLHVFVPRFNRSIREVVKLSRIDLPEINHAVGRDFGLNETHRYLVSLHNVFLHGVELVLLEISL